MQLLVIFSMKKKSRTSSFGFSFAQSESMQGRLPPSRNSLRKLGNGLEAVILPYHVDDRSSGLSQFLFETGTRVSNLQSHYDKI